MAHKLLNLHPKAPKCTSDFLGGGIITGRARRKPMATLACRDIGPLKPMPAEARAEANEGRFSAPIRRIQEDKGRWQTYSMVATRLKTSGSPSEPIRNRRRIQGKAGSMVAAK